MNNWKQNKEMYYKQKKTQAKKIDDLKNNLKVGNVTESIQFYVKEIIKTLSNEWANNNSIIKYEKGVIV